MKTTITLILLTIGMFSYSQINEETLKAVKQYNLTVKKELLVIEVLKKQIKKGYKYIDIEICKKRQCKGVIALIMSKDKKYIKIVF